MRSIVECVPNFSEGRNRSLVEEIAAAVQSVPGLCVMDLEMDSDHNRSVLTFVGEKERVGEGALRAIGKATELIDLTKHSGAHPRIGATDVVPFVPVRNATLEECVEIAKFVGSETWKRFGIPVYLYEAAATRPDRIQLENLRRGQFEGLKEEIGRVPDRHPDFGEPRLHPTCGATVVGARKFLIAYNINLNTADIEVAKRIAKAVRYSSGGLRYVKAMGVDLKARNQAQVSMNLTDYEQTPVHRVFELVRREAERYGVAVSGSEVVGLIPQKAFELTSEFFLRIENFRPELIFENRLAEILASSKGLSSMELSEFLESVAASQPVPGGGSVSALAGALAAALGQMVLGFTLNKKGFEVHQDSLEQQLRVLEKTREDLKIAIERDAEAYDQVVKAQKLPKENEQEREVRDKRLQESLKLATDVPMLIAEKACGLVRSIEELRPITNPNLASDLNVGFWMAVSAAKGALENVDINLKLVRDASYVDTHKTRTVELKELLKKACLSGL